MATGPTTQATATDLGEIEVRGVRNNPDVLRLKINRGMWVGWQEARITMRFGAVPNEFEVVSTGQYEDAYPPHELKATPGSPVQIYLGDDRVLTGYLDRRHAAMSNRGTIFTLAGRGRCQDLVECSPMLDSQQLTGITVLQAAQKLAEPYGIEVFGAEGPKLGVGGTLPSIPVPRGSKAFEIIEELCRLAGLVPLEDVDGTLILADGLQPSEWVRKIDIRSASSISDVISPAAALKEAASGFEEGVNILSASFDATSNLRYSAINGWRYGFDRLRDANFPNALGAALDAGVLRRRTLDVLIEPHPVLGLAWAEQRLAYEAAVRFGRSGILKLTTDNWRDSAGNLYAPAKVVRVKAPSINVQEGTSWLIAETTFRQSVSTGTQCDLTLVHPLAFARLPGVPTATLPRDVLNVRDQLAKEQKGAK